MNRRQQLQQQQRKIEWKQTTKVSGSLMYVCASIAILWTCAITFCLPPHQTHITRARHIHTFRRCISTSFGWIVICGTRTYPNTYNTLSSFPYTRHGQGHDQLIYFVTHTYARSPIPSPHSCAHSFRSFIGHLAHFNWNQRRRIQLKFTPHQRNLHGFSASMATT